MREPYARKKEKGQIETLSFKISDSINELEIVQEIYPLKLNLAGAKMADLKRIQQRLGRDHLSITEFLKFLLSVTLLKESERISLKDILSEDTLNFLNEAGEKTDFQEKRAKKKSKKESAYDVVLDIMEDLPTLPSSLLSEFSVATHPEFRLW